MARARALSRARPVWQNIKDFFTAHMVSNIGGLAFLLLTLFLLWPTIAMLIKSVYSPDGFTLQYYKKFLSYNYYYRSLLNTLILGTLTTSVCLSVGFCIAYMTTRGPVLLRTPLKLIALSPLIAPSFMYALSLIMLLGRNGIITKALNLSWSLYGFTGPVIAQTLAFLPLAYMMIESSLISLNPNLEDSSSNLGASEGKILRSITIPLLRPAFLKTALIIFVLSVAEFGNVALLRGRTPFLAPDTYDMLIGRGDFNMASVLSFFLILPCAAIFVIQNYLIKGKGYTTILGKPVAAEPRRITPIILIPFLIVSFVVCLSILVTFGILVVGAFTRIVGIDNTFVLRHILDVSSNAALFNSLRISFLAGLFGATMGIILAYVIVRGKFTGRAALEGLSMAGFALPGTVLGIGYILCFNASPLKLTGTILILIICATFRSFAVAEEAGIVKLKQFSIEVEEASWNLGASTATTFRRIVLPIVLPAFLYGFIYIFIRTMISLSAMIFLVTPGYPLAAVFIFDAAGWGHLGLASATTLKLIVVVFFSLAILHRLSKWTGLSAATRGGA